MKRAMIVAALMLAANPVFARDNPPSQTTFVSKKWAGSEAWVRGLNPNEKVVVLLAIKAAINDYIRENLEQSSHASTQGGAAWVGFTQSYANLMLSKAAIGNKELSLNFSMSADNALRVLNGDITKNEYIDRSSKLAFELRAMAHSIDNGYARRIDNTYGEEIADATASVLMASMEMAEDRTGYRRQGG